MLCTIAITELTFLSFTVTKGANYYGSLSEMKAAHFAASDVTSGLKQSNVARMNGGKSHMFRLFKEVVESKSYVKLAKEKIMFLPVASGSSSLAMAGAELGIHDVDRVSAESALKGMLQSSFNLLLDPRDEFRTHETVLGLRQGDNCRGVTCYHTDISEGMEIEPIQGSLRAMPREEQEGILRRHWGVPTFTQWQDTNQYQVWANNERRFNNHWKSTSSTNQPDVESTRRTKSMSNAYSSESEEESSSSDEESSGTKPSSSLSRGGRRFNPKPMSNAYSSESEDDSSSSDEESSGTKPSFVKKTLPRGKRFRLESDDESSSSDEESSGMGLPSSKKRAASPYKTSEDDEGKWSCKYCTYENDPSVKICAMCDQ